jgi:tRNA-dihydrouridine synthase
VREITPDEQPTAAVGKMKQFASWFTHGVPGGGALRKAVYEAKTGAAVLDAVDEFFMRESEEPEASYAAALAL